METQFFITCRTLMTLRAITRRGINQQAKMYAMYTILPLQPHSWRALTKQTIGEAKQMSRQGAKFMGI
jgi:hypothetical protein